MRVTLGDQSNKTFWEDFLATTPTLDIVIDDGKSWPQPRACASMSVLCMNRLRYGCASSCMVLYSNLRACTKNLARVPAAAHCIIRHVLESSSVLSADRECAGGHTMNQQITTFEALYHNIAPDGARALLSVSQPRHDRSHCGGSPQSG